MIAETTTGIPEAAPACTEATLDQAQALLDQAMGCDCARLIYPLPPGESLPTHVCPATGALTVRTWQHEAQIANTGYPYPLEYRGRALTLAVRQWAAEPHENRHLARALEASPYWQHALALAARVSTEDLFAAIMEAEVPAVPWTPQDMVLPIHGLLRAHALPDTPSVRQYLYGRVLGMAAPPLPRREVLVTTLLGDGHNTAFGVGAGHSAPPLQSVDDPYAWANGTLDKAALRVRQAHRAWLQDVRPHLFSAQQQGRLAAVGGRAVHTSYLAAGRDWGRLHALALSYRTNGGAIADYVTRHIKTTRSMVSRNRSDRGLPTRCEPGWQKIIGAQTYQLLEDPAAVQRLLDEERVG